jgi:hypothetical protein
MEMEKSNNKKIILIIGVVLLVSIGMYLKSAKNSDEMKGDGMQNKYLD